MRRFLTGLLLSIFLLTVVFLSLQPNEAEASKDYNNDYPIVLLHGLAGWGRDEVLGYKYWGGFSDYQEELKAAGHEVYTGVVGPFSSNWDRACELYAYIKGGTVDYGLAHSTEYGHARYGRTYPGIYPEWGEINPVTGEINKIHIIGHSMGGQTMRAFIHLLENGCPKEIEITPKEGLSPFFGGGKIWVASATGVSSPHDGATLADSINTYLPFIERLVASVAATVQGGNCLYDFKLDQWGLTRNDGESFSSYADRIWKSNIWRDTTDLSSYDLSTEGAAKLNGWAVASPNVYYFSIANECSYRGWLTGYYYPRFWMNPVLYPTSLLLGRTSNKDWRENDGVCNTISTTGPKVNSTDQIVAYSGEAQKGVWNYLRKESGWDHTAIVGHYLWDAIDIYLKHADLLRSLPTSGHPEYYRPPSQAFPFNGEYFKIINKNSGKVIDVDQFSTLDGARVIQWDYAGTDNQYWKIDPLGDGYYTMTARHSNKVLDISNASSLNGAEAVQWKYLGKENQQWDIKPLEDDSGYYQIIVRHSGKVLDVGSALSGDNIMQWDWSGKDTQKWEIVPK
ncbi:MAG: RICIN domain-containing protein [Firmicutes bacterium]|nr:RICIN domain-containing protein [Bacillota bacterium]